MSDREITRDEVLCSLRGIVREAGADMRKHCTYLYFGEPHCIVAVYLRNLGVHMQTLRCLDEVGSIASVRKYHPALMARLPRHTEEAWQVLAVAQRTQDDKCTWGEALSAAERFEA